MCARYVFYSGIRAIADDFGAVPLPNMEPEFNLAPTDVVAGIIVREGGKVATPFQWVLVPSWADNPSIGQKLINARSETAAEKPSFRGAMRYRRCILPADGFYEWKGPKGAKQPYYIYRADGKPIAFAGLWESWEKEGYLETCTILTTAANAEMSTLHDRMPVILEPAEYDRWLNPETTNSGDVLDLLDPASDGTLIMHPVGKAVGNPRASGPELIASVAAPNLFGDF